MSASVSRRTDRVCTGPTRWPSSHTSPRAGKVSCQACTRRVVMPVGTREQAAPGGEAVAQAEVTVEHVEPPVTGVGPRGGVPGAEELAVHEGHDPAPEP